MTKQKSLIDYWSYSSMNMLMRNSMAWKKRYVLKVYDDISSPSSMLGKAAHKALEGFYNGKEISDAIDDGLEYINNTSDTGIDWGKTGNRAKLLDDYTRAINFYFEEQQTPHEILGVEEEVVAEIKTTDDQQLGLPAKGFMDLVVRNKLGELEVIDHKFVRGYTDQAIDSFPHFLQAMFNYHLLLAKYGEAPKRVIFNECKISKNKDGSPQIQPYTVEFEGKYGDFATFYKLYNSCTKYINLPGQIFLPNPADLFDGQNSFEVFRSGVMGVERPTSVSRRTEAVQFTEKNYVPSATDRIENKQLTPEERIRMKLNEFGAPVAMGDTHAGPSITKYTMKPSRGVSMRKIASCANDLALVLEADSIRVEAPIKGTDLVGVEVPNKQRKVVKLAESHLRKGTMELPIGINVYNETVYGDLTQMPHLLIAGATGSGKSVMLNVILTALTRQMPAAGLDLILIDPKRVELSQFAKVPHLKRPIVYDITKALEVLSETVDEMERRYEILESAGARSIEDYKGDMKKTVVVIDEFADLIMSDMKPSAETMDIAAFTENLGAAVHAGKSGKLTQKAVREALRTTVESTAPASAEESIIRIAQKARAVGIHLILATQRPSADVVTGLIKANIPTKIAFMTTSRVNSQIILDADGAEQLTGKGDMLYLDPSARELQRLQGLLK